MKKFFSLVLALVMALSLTTVAWGADPVAKIGDTPYDSLQAAVDAAGAGAIIVLQNDTAVSGVVEGAGVKVPTGKDITIDFNGLTYKITSAVGDYGTLGFQLLKDSDVVLKNGAITSKAGSNVKMLINNYSNLTLYDIMLDGSNLDGNAPNYTLSNNNGDTTIGSGTTIVAKDNGVAFDVCWSDYYTDGAQVTVEDGAVIEGEVALTLWDQTTYDANQSILTVNGGSFDSAITIDDTYGADVDDVKDFVTISDGTFAVAPAEEFLADGFVPVLVNGVYVPQKAADNSVNKGSNGIDTEDWKVVDLTTGTAYDIAEDAEVEKIVYKDIKNTVNGKTTIRYGVTLYGPLTFEDAGAAANGGYAMVVAKDSANIQLETDAGKIIFARFLTAAEYAEYAAMDAQYAYTTLVATKFVEAADAPYDCEDPYMDYYVVGDDYYAAASSNADNTLVRYKNEFVLVGAKLDAEPLVPHAFMIAPGDCKWSIKDNELSSVKCTCDDTFKVVQDIKGLKAGSYYALGDGNYVVLKATSSGKLPSGTTVVPSTDKVQSADTFDAGIAMYVGMSVMAAAGSAVVIGKKKD